MLGIFVNGDQFATETLEYLRDPSDSTKLDMHMRLDNRGGTALHWAAACARIKTVGLLVLRGAKPTVVDCNGETPLMHAIASHSSYESETFPTLIRLLEKSLHVRDAAGRTILHHAAFLSQCTSKRTLSRYYTFYILQHLANINCQLPDLLNAQDSFGHTALHIAARFKNHRVVQMLLRAGCDPSVQDYFGQTPLDAADEHDSRMQRLLSSDKDFTVPEMFDIDDYSDAPTEALSDVSDESSQSVRSTVVRRVRRKKMALRLKRLAMQRGSERNRNLGADEQRPNLLRTAEQRREALLDYFAED
eukprot:jgi/Hompol1/2869/HPOL_006243-RA